MAPHLALGGGRSRGPNKSAVPVVQGRLRGMGQMIAQNPVDGQIRIPPDGRGEMAVILEGQAVVTQRVVAVLRLGHGAQQLLADQPGVRGIPGLLHQLPQGHLG